MIWLAAGTLILWNAVGSAPLWLPYVKARFGRGRP